MNFNPLSIFTDPQMRELCAELTALGIEKASQRIQKYQLDQNVRASLLTQVQLRHQAVNKLGSQALKMFFTRDGMEQATRQQIAQLHATRFLNANATHIADLGCGNGVDARAFAAAKMTVSAWEIDEISHAAASLNLLNYPNCTVYQGDVTQLNIPELTAQGIDAIFADPARRTGAGKGNQRVASPENWSPSLPQVFSWREELQKHCDTERLGVKLAPGIEHHYLPADMEAQWISVAGNLLEASLWSPACTLPTANEEEPGPGRRATIFQGENQYDYFCPGNPGLAAPEVSETSELKPYLWEADSAIIRGGLLHLLAEETGAEVISKQIAYLLADAPPPAKWAPAVTVYEVLGSTKLKPKAVAAELKKLAATNVEVKKRGAEIDPANWQKELLKSLKLKKTSADNPLTVVGTRFKGSHLAVITRRIK
ncbi:SAM-dependent methyltransferase [Gleimia sp. 6138-11-ORH1]|uniref:THUMP-like domain-containing protein n=1 Tax=Gleimia sp. 6138-11-ORH1 TaxID=2973937 RepID=UPI00216782D6|nr:SAM-dependent methyltransferase [Gleimia sp. 6138-11-ORH1]MCS4483911.1 SAM-dependent methyltransferase [Gleimia sp. 6138-11-ORH1]